MAREAQRGRRSLHGPSRRTRGICVTLYSDDRLYPPIDTRTRNHKLAFHAAPPAKAATVDESVNLLGIDTQGAHKAPALGTERPTEPLQLEGKAKSQTYTSPVPL